MNHNFQKTTNALEYVEKYFLYVPVKNKENKKMQKIDENNFCYKKKK